jgi:hypothetical protein
MVVQKLIGVLIAAAALTTEGMRAPVTFTTIVQGDQSGIEEAREVVVRTPAEWKALWQQHAPGQPPPAVDFGKSMVVGVFAGFRGTGGYQVTIAAIDQQGSDLVVTWHETRPGKRDIVTQMLTFPHHLVRLDRADAPVKFKKAEKPAGQ